PIVHRERARCLQGESEWVEQLHDRLVRDAARRRAPVEDRPCRIEGRQIGGLMRTCHGRIVGQDQHWMLITSQGCPKVLRGRLRSNDREQANIAAIPETLLTEPMLLSKGLGLRAVQDQIRESQMWRG